MATDGAVHMNPETEALLEEGALLRKASEQQNAQWRLNEHRLKQLGVKKARARTPRAPTRAASRQPPSTRNAPTRGGAPDRCATRHRSNWRSCSSK